MERVTGIGGVFFRAKNPESLVAWYADHLGVPVVEGYVIFPEQGMVNFTVSDLEAMLDQLRGAGVEVDDKIEVLEGIGRFGWAVDPEGNRFELWEPVRSHRSQASA